MTITAIAIFLSGTAIGILVILFAGVRSDDRARNLTRVLRTRTAAVTRRLLGIDLRSAEAGSENDDEHA
jgi:hypothetical protein